MKKLLFILILLISASVLYAELLTSAASDAAAGEVPEILPAGKAVKLTCKGTCKGQLTYRRTGGKEGSHNLYFEDTGYYIPYDNISALNLPEGTKAELLAADNVFLYNGHIYNKYPVKKETAKPEKVFKTSGDTFGLGILKNGSFTVNADYQRQYFGGQSGFVCQTEDGLYKLDKVTVNNDNIVFSCPDINTQITAVFTSAKNHINIHCKADAADPDKPSKALTAAVHIAIGAGAGTNWVWQNCLNTATTADGQLQELQERPLAAPFFYPMAFMFDPEKYGIAMFLDPSVKNPPANISYSGAMGSMYSVFELKEGKGEFSIDLSKHDSDWGMREPWRYYSEVFGEYFKESGEAAVTPDKLEWNNNSFTSSMVTASLTDTELLFVRAMAGSRKVYMDMDMPLSETKEAAARAMGFGFIPKSKPGQEIGKVKEMRELAEKIFALPWQPVPEASANNPAVTTERFGDKSAEKYYIVCKNTSSANQPAIIRIFTLPSAKIEIKELIYGTEKTAVMGDISTVFMPGEILIFEIENRWK